MFAGQELQDDLLLERDYKLDSYSLADKVRRWLVVVGGLLLRGGCRPLFEGAC